MAGPVEQTGVVVACPECGSQVMQKEMIPVGSVESVDGVVRYLCVPCARTLLKTAGAVS
jgi:DNA-directed RNA polymerase subunit RPC12/RpoP